MAQKKIKLEFEAKGLDKAVDHVDDLNDGLKDTKKASKVAIGGIQGIGLAINGIGGVVTAITKAFEFLYDIFKNNQKFLDTFNIGMEVVNRVGSDFANFVIDNFGKVVDYFKQVFSDPVGSIKDLGAAIQQNLINRFEAFLDTMGHLGQVFVKLFKGDFSGAVDEAKEAGKSFVDSMTGIPNTVDKVVEGTKNLVESVKEYAKETITAAKNTNELKKAVELGAAENELLQAQYEAQAEKLRQIRDDESLTITERINANNELNDVLNKQMELQKANAQAALDLALTELALNDNQANQIAVIQARTELQRIETDIIGQLSEQKTNAYNLEKEQAESLNELLNELEEELDADREARAEKEQKRHDDEMARAEARVQAEDMMVGATANAIGAISNLFEQGSKAAKASALAELAINTGMGFIRALEIAQKSAAGTGPAAAFAFPIFYASQIASVLGAASRAKSILQSGGTGGGGGTPQLTPPRPTQARVPSSLTITPTGGNSEGSSRGEAGTRQSSMRAYVVESDITDTQNRLASYRSRSEIG